MTEEQIKHMANRFLGWKLPENFHPDAGISFTPEYNVEYNASQGKPPSRHEPIGTNLFNATQAEAMVRYMIEGLPGLNDLERAAMIADEEAEREIFEDKRGFCKATARQIASRIRSLAKRTDNGR
jgi:hypothetical protein